MRLAGVDAGPDVGGGVIGVDSGCTAFVSRDAVEGWCGLKSLMEEGKGHGHSCFLTYIWDGAHATFARKLKDVDFVIFDSGYSDKYGR